MRSRLQLIWLVFLALLFCFFASSPIRVFGQSLPPECGPLKAGETRYVVRTDIPKGYGNQTPTPNRCQIVQRGFPQLSSPAGRVPMAVWFVDVQTGDGVQGVVVDMDSTHKTSPAGGLLTFNPLAWDDMTLSMLSVPSGYNRIGPLYLPAGVKTKKKEFNEIRDTGVLVIVEMAKK